MKSVLMVLAVLTLLAAPVLFVRSWLGVLMTYDTDEQAANTAMTAALVAVLAWWVALVYVVRHVRQDNARLRTLTATKTETKLVPVHSWDPETRICPSCGKQIAAHRESRCDHCWAPFVISIETPVSRS